MCAQCGTRHEDWDHGGDDEEDAYVPVLQRCVGCQVIADKQAELEKDTTPEDARGMKVALVDAAMHAATQVERELSGRRRRSTDEDDD